MQLCGPYNAAIQLVKEENKLHYVEFPNFGAREFLGSLAELIMQVLPSFGTLADGRWHSKAPT